MASQQKTSREGTLGGLTFRDDVAQDYQEDGLRSKPYYRYLLRLGTVMGAAGFFGSVLGFMTTMNTARKQAAEVADQATLSRATLQGFQQTRYLTQKAIWTRSVQTGFKFAAFSGLFSGIELGLSYYRGYWDAFNPLLAGTGAGVIYAVPFMGLRGIQFGAAVGGLLAMPVTIAEILMRVYVTDDDLMPSVVLVADVPSTNVPGTLKTQLIQGEELEKELSQLPVDSPKKR